MSNITASTDITQVTPELLPKFVDLFFQSVKSTVNGNLDFATNFNCKLISVVFSAANANTLVNHGLGRTPAGYIITGASAATSVYNGTGTNATKIGLMASSPATVGLIVY